ncbi:HpcH/HpaI aldolase family protein [Pseudodonghicola flavimaris]|uniref:Aldolase/citrate lyase family protein n=1 Tax=Pseudodonghicola flavimaris TaxID=3050036 RepID=A0ABT7EXJ8_9RHOB|nr:aldolase/citrate lyase family protein [Pseudodonghicola flavimaris]MDK3017067.1 aldolase/citrate lyase family protein [Pseudodonghicola flavimaris]
MTDTVAAPLRAHLQAGGTVELFWFSLGSPAMVEMSATARPQAIMIDAQHGLWTREGLENVAGLMQGRVPLMVRTADASHTAAATALDAGAVGVLAPLIETAAEARAFVDASRYPPQGRRSGGGVRPLMGDFARYYSDALEQTVVGVMVETAAGLENIEEIAAVPGIDLIFIGTGDLAISMGEFPVPGPAYEAAIQRVRQVCAAAGVPCGLFSADAADARRRTAEGFAVTVSANDIALVTKGFAAAAPEHAGDSETG